MPAAALKNFAKKTHTKMGRAEHLWNKAKEIVSKEYKYSHNDPEYWSLVMGITKKMMGVHESDKITFKRFISEEPMDSIDFFQHVVNSYNRHGKNFKIEEVKVEHKGTKYSAPKMCYNNSFRYMLLENEKAKYVLGYVIYHSIPIEHAWIQEGSKYFDLTLDPSQYDGYVKLTSLPFKEVNKFVSENGHPPSMHDTLRM